MRRGYPVAATAAVLALAVALGGGLSACGKRGTLRAPDDATEAFTHPRIYPNPATVRPSGLPSGEPAATPRTREVLPGDDDLSPFPDPRRKTTYGDPDAP